MGEFAELPPKTREANQAWIENTIIPHLYENGAPKLSFSRVMRILYRAGTTGITDSQFQADFAELGTDAAALPTRGDTRAKQLLIRRPDDDGIYIAPFEGVAELTNELASLTETAIKDTSNFEQALPIISDYVLWLDALHPHYDGTGRLLRAGANYLAYPYHQRFAFPLKQGHLDQQSTLVAIMQEFRDWVQAEAGLPILTQAVLGGTSGRFNLKPPQLSNQFSSLIQQGRDNPRLLPFYRQMDKALLHLAQPRENHS